MSNFWGQFFLCFGGQKKILKLKILKIFLKYFSNRIEKLHKMAFIKIFLFFLKKFEKVEKTGIISTKFSLRCTPSVILGSKSINYPELGFFTHETLSSIESNNKQETVIKTENRIIIEPYIISICSCNNSSNQY